MDKKFISREEAVIVKMKRDIKEWAGAIDRLTAEHLNKEEFELSQVCENYKPTYRIPAIMIRSSKNILS